MRLVKNDLPNPLEIIQKNAYEKPCARYFLDIDSSDYLPFYDVNSRLFICEFRDEVAYQKELFIYQGAGAQLISESFKKYNLDNINALEIDYFLQHDRFKSGTKNPQGIKDFINLLEHNFSSYTLLPKGFLELERALF